MKLDVPSVRSRLCQEKKSSPSVIPGVFDSPNNSRSLPVLLSREGHETQSRRKVTSTRSGVDREDSCLISASGRVETIDSNRPGGPLVPKIVVRKIVDSHGGS